MGFGKASLKGSHLQLQPEIPEGLWLRRLWSWEHSQWVTVIPGGPVQGAPFSRQTREDGLRWDSGSRFPCPWPRGVRNEKGEGSEQEVLRSDIDALLIFY